MIENEIVPVKKRKVNNNNKKWPNFIPGPADSVASRNIKNRLK